MIEMLIYVIMHDNIHTINKYYQVITSIYKT